MVSTRSQAGSGSGADDASALKDPLRKHNAPADDNDDGAAPSGIAPFPPCTVAPLAHILMCLVAVLPLWVPIDPNLNVILTASTCVFLGCFRSVKPTPPTESMTKNDAMRFPVVGSCVLLSLFVLFKVMPKEYLNAALSIYFLLLGTLAITGTILPFIAPYVPASYRRKELGFYGVSIPYLMAEPTDIVASVPELVGGVVSLGFCAWYVAKKHWLANNVLGLCFSIQGIEFISIGSFQVGLILLWGLFFYDIFWVFFTPVMVSVAKSFDAPIKLLFPRPGDDLKKFSLLGLGDIVIPGIFVALMLRYDIMRYKRMRNSAKKEDNDDEISEEEEAAREAAETRELVAAPCPYFKWTFAGYVLGLVATIVVMNVFNAAQPALLYIVPGVVGAAGLKALIDGNLKELYHFEDGGGDASAEASTDADEDTKKK